MRSRILRRAEYSVNEATISITSDWPTNWKAMGEWTTLQALGFEDATTPQMEKNGNILLMNPDRPIYPGGLVLQRSGYIRNKLATSGFVKKYERGFTLKDMFDYLIGRFSKIQATAGERSPEWGDLPDRTVIFLNKIINGPWSVNQETGRIDTPGNVNLSKIKNLPEGVRFGVVGGHFDCSYMGLETLEIAPTEVGGSFNCSSNRLTSLEGAPQRVGVHFICDNNKLETLRGCPEVILYSFDCSSNRLTSLAGGPGEVRGSYFNCSKNPLKSFLGAPAQVDNFYGHHTHVKSAEGVPITRGRVELSDCKRLETLRDLPLGTSCISLSDLTLSIYTKGGDGVPSGVNPVRIRGLISAGILKLSSEWGKISDHELSRTPLAQSGDLEVYCVLGIFSSSFEGRRKEVSLLMTLVSDAELDAFFSKNPLAIHVLDSQPEIKKGVLQRTGIKDFSELGRAIDKGLI